MILQKTKEAIGKTNVNSNNTFDVITNCLRSIKASVLESSFSNKPQLAPLKCKGYDCKLLSQEIKCLKECDDENQYQVLQQQFTASMDHRLLKIQDEFSSEPLSSIFQDILLYASSLQQETSVSSSQEEENEDASIQSKKAITHNDLDCL